VDHCRYAALLQNAKGLAFFAFRDIPFFCYLTIATIWGHSVGPLVELCNCHNITPRQFVRSDEFFNPTSFSENPSWFVGFGFGGDVCFYLFVKAFDFKSYWISKAGFFIWAAENIGRKEILATRAQVQIAILKSRFRQFYYASFHTQTKTIDLPNADIII